MFYAVNKILKFADITRTSYTQLQAANIAYVIIHRAVKFGLAICEWNYMPKIQKTWVRFKMFFGQLTESCERNLTSPLNTPVCIRPTWCEMLSHGYMNPCSKSKSRQIPRQSYKRLYIMWPTRCKTPSSSWPHSYIKCKQ